MDEEDFIEGLEYCITENIFNELIDEYAYKLEYDIIDIYNICDNYKGKNKEWSYPTVITICKNAYMETITRDKTIKAQVFVDNIVKRIKKISKRYNIMYIIPLTFEKILKHLHTRLVIGRKIISEEKS